MHSIMRKATASLMIAAALTQSSVPFAAAQANPETTIVEDSAGVKVIEGDGASSVLSTVEDESRRIVSVVDLSTGERNEIVLDKSSGTITSTYTGETINAEATTSGGATARSTRTAKKSTVYKYSWKQIRDLVGGAGGVAGIVAGIMALTGVGAVSAPVVAAIAGIIGGIGSVIPDDPNHGIKVTVQNNNNPLPQSPQKTITSVWVY